MPQSKRGGARPGSGRKRKPPAEHARRLTITLPPEILAAVRAASGGNESALIASVLAAHFAAQPAPIRRAELWQRTSTGDRYAVLTDGGIPLYAAGPLDDAGAAAVEAGQPPEWDAATGDMVAAGDEAGQFVRLWPEPEGEGADADA